MTRRLRSAVLPLSLLATSFLPFACGAKGGTPAVCGELAAYMPTTTTPLSYATDVYPIMANTSATTGGCSQENACHGLSPLPINALQSKTLQFLYSPESPAMAKAQLLMTSINVPTMQRVTPSNVAASLLSYKVSGKDGLSCISSMCSAHASVGTPPCGDPMPSIGSIAASDRTKILDWIATGAAD